MEDKNKNQTEVLLRKEIKSKELELYGIGFKKINPYIVLNVASNKIWINKKEYDFSDILDIDVQDEVKQSSSGSKITTKTNSKSMVGRAIIGGVLLGPLGAAVGACTANKSSVISPTNTCIEHNYSVLITTSKVSKPLITLNFKNDLKAVNRCVSTIKSIINKKK